MAFLRSLFSGVSALRNHQTMMDVIGNNIANVNTVGFKAGRTTFSELYAQTVQGASRPTATNGGTNPMQVGLGMSVSTIDTLFTAGNIETTAVPFDLAITTEPQEGIALAETAVHEGYDAVIAAVDAFCRPLPQTDDLTLVVVKIEAQAPQKAGSPPPGGRLTLGP